MVALKNYMKEIYWSVIFLVFLIFVLTNVSNKLGQVYLQFLFGSIILLFVTLLVFDKNVEVTVKKLNTSWVEEFFYGIGGWVILLIASYFILNATGTGTTFGSIISMLGAANPIFSDSVFINFLIIGAAIPFAETVFFSRLLEVIGDLFNLKVTKSSIKTFKFIVIILVLSSLFALFHATSKNLAGPALLVVALMLGISLILIAWRGGDTRSAIFLHIAANSVATILLLTSGGTLNFGA